jgi:hypothetical protein
MRENAAAFPGTSGTPDPWSTAGSRSTSEVRMAPGGVEPPHTDSKSVALSTELRGLG